MYVVGRVAKEKKCSQLYVQFVYFIKFSGRIINYITIAGMGGQTESVPVNYAVILRGSSRPFLYSPPPN